jgi:hypothetical protein
MLTLLYVLPPRTSKNFGQIHGKLLGVNNQKLKCSVRAKSLTFKELNDINNPKFLPNYLTILNRLYKISSVILIEIFNSQKAKVLRTSHCMNDTCSTHEQQSIKQSMSQ